MKPRRTLLALLASLALAAHAASGRHGEGGWLFLFLVLASLTPVAGVAGRPSAGGAVFSAASDR